MSDKLQLKVFEGGPLEVKGASSVTYCGEPVEAEGDLYFCRCGQSSNAPFCDGTHSREGFEDDRGEGGEKSIRVWEGKTLKTYFNPNVCIHVFYCKPLRELRERELEGDLDAAAEIRRVVGICPSGALSYEDVEEADAPTHPDPVADIEVIEGGEIRVRREFEIDVPLPERCEGDRATLCRCGASKNKPFCDGSHGKLKDFR